MQIEKISLGINSPRRSKSLERKSPILQEKY